MIQNAFKQATQEVTGSSTQNLSGLQTSLGLSNTQTQQQVSGTQATTQQSLEQGNTQTQALTNQQTTGTTTEAGKQTAFADQDIEAIRALLPGIFGQAAQNFEFASAGNLPAQVEAIQRQLMEQILPGIVAQDSGAGAYNSTSRQILAGDAIARGANQAAIAQVDAARTAGQAVQPITDLAQILKGAEQNTSGSSNVLQSLLGSTNTSQISQIQQLLQSLTANQQNTTGSTATQNQEQTATNQTSTEQNQQSTASTEAATTNTSEDSTTSQDGISTTTGKGKSKESGFSLGFG